jgi:hypothetical protein
MRLRAPCSATERLRAPAVSVKVGMDNEKTRLGLLDPGSEENDKEEEDGKESNVSGEEGTRAAAAAAAALSRRNAMRCAPHSPASLSASSWRGLEFTRGFGGRRT